MRGNTFTAARPYARSWSASLWIIVILQILMCHMSSERVNARVINKEDRWINDEGKVRAMLQKPGINNSPPGDDKQIGNKDDYALRDNELLDGSPRGFRDSLDNRHKNDENGVKHFRRIPASNNNNGPVRRRLPDPEESTDETFESLEGNREAMLEILNENAKHRHRKRPVKKHSKMHLRYNTKLQRLTLTEEQSDEWII